MNAENHAMRWCEESHHRQTKSATAASETEHAALCRQGVGERSCDGECYLSHRPPLARTSSAHSTSFCVLRPSHSPTHRPREGWAILVVCDNRAAGLARGRRGPTGCGADGAIVGTKQGIQMSEELAYGRQDKGVRGCAKRRGEGGEEPHGRQT